jgi:hypothetical protein
VESNDNSQNGATTDKKDKQERIEDALLDKCITGDLNSMNRVPWQAADLCLAGPLEPLATYTDHRSYAPHKSNHVDGYAFSNWGAAGDVFE